MNKSTKTLKATILENRILIRRDLKKDFFSETRIKISENIILNEETCYYLIHNEKKYVHKNSFRLVYMEKIFDEEKYANYFEKNALEQFIAKSYYATLNLFRNSTSNSIIPSLLKETKDFFIFRHYEFGWKKNNKLSKENFQFIKHWLFSQPCINDQYIVTPFHMSVHDSLIRNKVTGEVKLLNLEDLELREKSPCVIYINDPYKKTLYVDKKNIHNEIKHEYFLEDCTSIDNAEIIYYLDT